MEFSWKFWPRFDGLCCLCHQLPGPLVGNDIIEVERQFRSAWRSYEPSAYPGYLAQVNEQDQLELLARLLTAEIEFAYQPPAELFASSANRVAEDDERIRPSLPLLLAQYPALKSRSDLVIRLCVLEYALRLQHDRRAPNPESYLSLCSHSQDHLWRLLQRTEDKLPVRRLHSSEEASPRSSDSTIEDEPDSLSHSIEPLPNNLGCFLLIDLIGRGGMGFVYSAIDLRSAAPVAVKVMRRDDSWSVYRFIEEFSWLSQVSHPNLVKLYDACNDGDLRYFSMELVEGKTVRPWFERAVQKYENPWQPLKKVLVQAASAIHFLHQQGVIHCDIKSSNLMITPRRRAVLLDLGLAVSVNNPDSEPGTLQSTAPEVLAGQRHSPASDWYSFGFLIYETIARDLNPRALPTASWEIQDRCTLDREHVRRQMEYADADLVDLCCELLDPNPALRPVGEAVLSRLGGTPTPILPVGQLAGREPALEQLNLVLKRARERGTSGIAFVHGESGMGKTSTVDRWLQQFDHHRELVVKLRCFHQDQTPLRLLNGLVQELVQVLSSLPATFWRDTVDRHLDPIAEAFPQVRQLVDPGLSLDRRRAVAVPTLSMVQQSKKSLANCLIELSQQKEIVITVDDGQWADEQSVSWLLKLFQNPDFHGFLVAIEDRSPGPIAERLRTTLASHGTSPKSELGAWPEAPMEILNINLSPLPAEISKRLLEEWSNLIGLTMTRAVMDNIVTTSDGNPFLLKELFVAYSRGAQRDSITDENWLCVDSQNSMRRRFSQFPVQAENILQYLAITDQPIGFHQLQIVSRILPDELQRTLYFLASQGWVRSRSQDLETDIEISHQRFREVIIGSLPKERLQRRHFRMARMLSTDVPAPWSKMGHHYWAAEHYREAAACYMQAARNALQSSLFQEALHFLERALHEEAVRNPQEMEEALRLKADCLTAIGNSRKAAAVYDRLGESTQDSDAKLLYRSLAGMQWIRAGQPVAGLARLEVMMHQLGIAHRKPSPLHHLSLRFKILGQTLCERFRSARRDHPQSFGPRDQNLNHIALPFTFLDNHLGPDLILRLKRLSDTMGSQVDRSLAISHYGLLLSIGRGRWQKRALRCVLRGLRIARASGSPAAIGSAHLGLFVVKKQQGKLRRALTHANSGLGWYAQESRNMQWEIQFLNWGILGCYWNMMHLRQLRKSCLEFRQHAEASCDSMSQYFMHVAAAHLSDLVVADTGAARKSIQIAARAISNQTYQSPRFFLWLSHVQQELYEGNYQEATFLLERDWPRLRKAYVFSASDFQRMAVSLRLCCYLVQLRERHSVRVLRRAQKYVRKMLRLEHAPFLAQAKAFDLVVRAADGKIAPSVRWQAVIDELDQLDHHLFANALRWHLSLYLPDSLAHTLQRKAEQVFRDEGCIEPINLMDIILPLPGRVAR